MRRYCVALVGEFAWLVAHRARAAPPPGGRPPSNNNYYALSPHHNFCIAFCLTLPSRSCSPRVEWDAELAAQSRMMEGAERGAGGLKYAGETISFHSYINKGAI